MNDNENLSILIDSGVLKTELGDQGVYDIINCI